MAKEQQDSNADDRQQQQIVQLPCVPLGGLTSTHAGTAPCSATMDQLVAEAPLSIRYAQAQNPQELQTLTTLLRTPGDDIALSAGFLFAEGYLRERNELEWMHYCHDSDAVQAIGLPRLEVAARHHLTHAGCGSCALENIQHLYSHLRPVNGVNEQGQIIPKLQQLIQQLVASSGVAPQALFAATGGSHAAALFDDHGKLLASAEDAGRHNALDKAIGRLWLDEKLPAAQLAWVSGRLGFELVQKAINAGLQAIVAVGAPTSLAIELAHSYRLAAFAFCRDGGGNFYP